MKESKKNTRILPYTTLANLLTSEPHIHELYDLAKQHKKSLGTVLEDSSLYEALADYGMVEVCQHQDYKYDGHSCGVEPEYTPIGAPYFTVTITEKGKELTDFLMKYYPCDWYWEKLKNDK